MDVSEYESTVESEVDLYDSDVLAIKHAPLRIGVGTPSCNTQSAPTPFADTSRRSTG